jgi:CRP-like cAMP-binding protein
MVAIPLPVREVLYRPNGPIDYVYFPRTGVMSMVIRMEDGGSVEVGMVGYEGFVGVPAFLGTDRSPTQVFCQVPGSGLRMPVAAFRDEVRREGAFQLAIMRYTQSLLNTVSQSTACNQLHAINLRCARWLLATHDRVGEDEFPLTQEFFAMMLGVRRASVTVAAGVLQKAGLISYHRGHIRIIDRPGLEAASCECYRLMRDELDRLLK